MLAAPQQRPRPLPLFLALLREQTAGEPERAARALEGLRRYQQWPRSEPAAPMPAIAAIDGALLRDYGGTGPTILFVPSLINPPNVLDLAGRSLLRWLAAAGHHVLLLDWGWPGEARRALSVTGHVERILLPLIDRLERPVSLVGYCLGGTMAAAAAARRPAVRGLATIAAPWHFAGFPDDARERLAALWSGARPTVERMGLLPMEVLQSAFWNLDPARTVGKFEAFAGIEGAEAEMFVTLEDWANDGPPLAGAAARELFEDMFARDVTGTGQWRVEGESVTLDEARPMLHIVSASDRIVPAASAPDIGERLVLSQGHVGMVAGSQACERLWKPLAGWLSRTAAE